MATNHPNPPFLPSGDKARGASKIRAIGAGAGAVGCHATQTANVGDYLKGTVMTEVTVSPIAVALTAFVKADGKAHDCGTSYMALAVAAVWNGTDKAAEAANLIADMCKATGSVGKVTKEFPNGKPNPQALKSNGFSGLAEAARLLRKVADKADNENVIRAVEGFLGVVQNEAQFKAHQAEDKRVIRAVESGDEGKLERAEAAFLADYLNLTYPDRPTSFSSLRRALDKATTATGTATEETAPAGEGSGEGEGADVSSAAAVIGAEEMATSLIGRIGELSDNALSALFDAVKADMTRRVAEMETEEALAA